MKIVRISDPDQIKPLHVAMVLLVAVTLAGSCLLTSGAHREILHDGQVEWGPDSPLRALVSVLNLQFTQTTSKGVEIKSLVFGLGSWSFSSRLDPQSRSRHRTDRKRPIHRTN